MALFQNSVINKYIQKLDKQILQNAYTKFRSHFHNASIQENIRGSKEEQYQGEFLIDLFVNVLGYTKNPTPNFNLTTEYKNVKDSKKADGAIIINETVKCVIELKGTNTTDLNKIETQAFGYKNNQPECDYVITSNFEKIRFYIDNAIEYTEFNLFTLTEKEFELLYVCLSFKSIAKGLPKQIKDESVSQESLITKKLYNDYSVFKNELYHNLVKLNPQYEPLELFKKSQKLLDRFLFIFFAEDRQLLPTNLIFRINKEWQQLREMRIEVSLYDRYKIYFNDLDQGAKVSLPAFSQTASKQKEEFQIYAYNGGLFKTDDLLNDIKIEDELLFSHTEKLSNYDFASEVDVNVLGHIFENSLNDVDELAKRLANQSDNSSLSGRHTSSGSMGENVGGKGASKRKKDGVFYTPKYITKYIVDNTVGKLCLEKKEALQLTESDYAIDKKRPKKTTQVLTDKLNEYRNWLLQLTICDPACGSGAFLNQALDFLITEHQYIDELQAKLFGDALVLSDVEGSILENNLFGVDINEESVEIAKLSLWLRTAQPNRKLNDLNSNIKCGNSLIDDVAVAGDKAFNWEQEFPQVFQNAVKSKNYRTVEERIKVKSPFATKDELGNYKDDNYGIYNEFHEPKVNYTNKEKKHGFDVVIGNPPYVRRTQLESIVTKELEHKYYAAYKQFDLYILFNELSLKISRENSFIGFIQPNKFLSAEYGYKILNLLVNNVEIKSIYDVSLDKIFESASVYPYIFIFKKKSFIKDIVDRNISLFNFCLPENLIGFKNYTNSNFVIEKIKKYSIIIDNITNSVKRGIPNSKITFINEGQFYGINSTLLQFPYYLTDANLKFNYLSDNDRNLKTKEFSSNLILLPRTILRIRAVKKTTKAHILDRIYYFEIKDDSYTIDYIICILNSRITTFYYDFLFGSTKIGGGYIDLKGSQIEQFLIPIIERKKQKPFIEKADLMLSLNKELEETSQKFQRTLQRKFELQDLPKKLEEWYLLSYSDFIKELAKKKIKLSLPDEAEWEEYFNTESKKALELKSKIDTTDKEIDQMVYKLYDLTEEEIKIVEGE